MWDFRKVKWVTKDKMRYDTPGDYHGDLITAWSGLPELSQMGVQLHEFVESAILRAAGITDEQIDILDRYMDVTRRFSMAQPGETVPSLGELGDAAIAYEAIPKWTRNLYDQAHVIALMVERAFIEATGGNWKEHDDNIEATRGKIPIAKPKPTPEEIAARLTEGPVFTDDELVYAATSRCSCGVGMAYPKRIGPHGHWDCSDILTGRAIPKDQPGAKKHEDRLPFMFWKIKSELQPSAQGMTTRGKIPVE